MAKYKLSIRDNTRELTRTEFWLDPIGVGNIGDILAALTPFKAALQAIVLGVLAKEAVVLDETNLSSAKPTDPTAQRGIKWSVQYVDTTEFFDPGTNAIPNEGYQQIFTNTIGTAKLSLLVDGAEDLVLTSGVGATFKAQFDGLVKSPYGGSVSLLRVYYSD